MRQEVVLLVRVHQRSLIGNQRLIFDTLSPLFSLDKLEVAVTAEEAKEVIAAETVVVDVAMELGVEVAVAVARAVTTAVSEALAVAGETAVRLAVSSKAAEEIPA